MYFALFVLPLLKEVKSEQNDLLCFILYLTTFDFLLYHCCLALTSRTVDPPVNLYISVQPCQSSVQSLCQARIGMRAVHSIGRVATLLIYSMEQSP